MSQDLTQHKPGAAIALRLISIFLFMVMAALVKSASDTVSAGQAVFFRSFFAFPIILMWLWQQHDLREGLKTRNPMGHLWRGLIGTSAMGLTFGGLGLLPLPEVTAIGYATPLFTVILAALLLGERIRIFRLSAVSLGLVGVMIVLAPRLGDLSLGTAGTIGAMMVLASSILRGLVQIHIRRLVQTEKTAAIVFYFALTATCISFLTLPMGIWIDALRWVRPDAATAAALVGAGLVGGTAQILVTASFRFAGPAMLAPFDYSSMIFASIIGYVAFSEVPSRETIIGSILVIAGGILIIWRERQLGLDRSRLKVNVPPQGPPD